MNNFSNEDLNPPNFKKPLVKTKQKQISLVDKDFEELPANAVVKYENPITMIDKIFNDSNHQYYIVENEIRIDTEAAAKVFKITPRNIRKHLKSMIESGEIDERELRNQKFFNLYTSLNPKKRGPKPYLINQDHMMLLGYKINNDIGILYRKWSVQVIKERLAENKDPSLILDRAIKGYKKKGYSNRWIRQRLQDKGYRIGFTHELKEHGIKHSEFGKITNTMYISWSGKNANEYYEFKELDPKKDNLRDHFSELESAINGLGELTATEMIKKENVEGYWECNKLTKKAGGIAKTTKENIEKAIGKPIVTKDNNKSLSGGLN